MKRLTILFCTIMVTQLSDGSQRIPEATGSMLDPFLSAVHREELPNGLTVLVKPDPGTGVVAINTWVRAGYFHEPDEVAGMAHLFEHMFFKGSKKFPGASQISTELSRVGGQTNAGTIYDSTNYYFVMPSENFARGLEIQADAIQNPQFDPVELDKESEVVIEESNRKLDNPSAVTMERMFATAFDKHRIRRWRIGSNDVLRAIDRNDLIAFFRTLYVPENIILSIAGDVTVEEAMREVRGTFGKIPRGQLRKQSGPAEPEQSDFRFGRSSADLQQGYTAMGWHTVPIGHDDELALDILGEILGSGRSSRFFRKVVGPEAASTAGAFNWSTDEVGVFVVSASFDETNRFETEKRLIQEIERLRVHGPTGYELAKASNGEKAGSIMQLQTALGQARSLAYAEANGGYRTLGARLAALEQLTPDRIRAVARKYLRPERLTLYHYQPDEVEPTNREGALTRIESALDDFESPPEPELEGPVRAAKVRGAETLEEPKVTTLDNGATLIVFERPGAPLVATGVYFSGGRIGENSSNAGITTLMQRVMRRGTTTRGDEEINREIEFLGTQIGTTTLADYFGFNLTIVREFWTAGIDILADVVLNPTFPDEGLTEERHLQRASIRRSLDSSTQRPFQLLYQTFYGNHPYGLPSNGHLTSIETIDRDDLLAWWSRWVRSDEAVIVVVGDVRSADAIEIVEKHFAALAPRTDRVELPEVPAWEEPQTVVETIERRERRQSAIAIAWPAVSMKHEDWPRLRLLQNVTSGLAGTFFNELRSKRSLAYTVFAGESARRDGGAFIGYLASDAAKEEEARKALVAEFRRLDDGGITEDDIERAKAYFAGSSKIARQTHSSHVDDLAEAWMYDLGLDFHARLLERVGAITLDEMTDTASRYFEGNDYNLAILSGNP